jgi:uncharacterized NAD(P)/FAD-binding protein YdhS
MSAWPDDPDDFALRFATEGGERRGFAERRLFGRYLCEILDRANGKIEVVEQTAVGATRAADGWEVELGDGSRIAARSLVVATGNQEPAALDVFAAAADRFVSNPWGVTAQAAVRELAVSGESVLLVGTGLTMVDLVLSLEAAGYRGRMVALSRRGLIPRSHAEFEPAPVEAGDVPSGDLLALSRWLRRRSAQVGWRAAVDSLRPHTQALWQSLGTERQRRFLRHARPWWDAHRSRIAPEVARTIAALIGEERLEIVAGRTLSSRRDGSGLTVEIRRRRSRAPETLSVAYAFNCTGPLHSLSRTKDALLRSLIDAGHVRPDPLDIGLSVDGRSRASGAHRIWALGPLTKGSFWEIIAVPDIRVQAASVAQDIAQELAE